MSTRSRRPSLVVRVRAVGGIVIVLVQTKGGSGKSTIALNLAMEYAERGLTVLVLDTDIQMTLMDAQSMRATPAQRVTTMAYPHDSVWADLARLRAGFDVVVIDGHGRHDRITRAVAAAGITDPHGVALVPVVASPTDIWATKRDMAPVIAEAAALVPWKPRVRMVLVRFDEKELITAASRDALARRPLAPTTRAELPRHTAYALAMARGQGVQEYDRRGAAAAEVAALATEVAELALLDPEPKPNEETRK